MDFKKLHMVTRGLADIGERMTKTGKSAASAAASSKALRQGARAAAQQFPYKELARMCGRAGVAGAVVDGGMGGVQALNAMRKGKMDGRQAAIHATAEAGCGFVTSSAGTAGTLAAYMLTGAMGPLAIAAGMGASVGSRYVYRNIVGETMPPDEDDEHHGDQDHEAVLDDVAPGPQER